MSKTPRTDAWCELAIDADVSAVLQLAIGFKMELHAVLKQNAQMREICEIARCLATGQDCPVDNLEIVCKAMDVLESDAGKDYVHKSEVGKAYDECHRDMTEKGQPDWFNSRARKIVK